MRVPPPREELTGPMGRCALWLSPVLRWRSAADGVSGTDVGWFFGWYRFVAAIGLNHNVVGTVHLGV